jgi:hypothetical protein
MKPHINDDELTRWPEIATWKKFGRDVGGNALEHWPEIFMAQADCYACHHDLVSDSWRQARPNEGPPGRPGLPRWPTAFGGLALPGAAPDPELGKGLQSLNRLLAARPFGDPAALGKAAAALEKPACRLANALPQFNPDTARQLLKLLCTEAGQGLRDYDTAREFAWAVRAIYMDAWNEADRDEKDKRHKKVVEILKSLDESLNLTVDSSARNTLTNRRQELTKGLAANSKARDLINTKGFLDALSAISEDELRAAQHCVNTYKPGEFRDRMNHLARLLAQ